MTDHNDEKKLSRRDALILGGGSLAGLILGGCAQAPPVEAPAVPTTAPAVEPPAPEAEAPAPAAEPVVQEITHLNTTPVNYIGRSLETCEGCRLCEIACSQFHEDGKFWPAASRVRIHEYHPGLEFPVLCYQCGNAPCVEACPEGAITIDPETSTMIYDETKCLRVTEGADCTECFDACPGNAITFHPDSQLPISCDMCGGEEPQCVIACRAGALTFNGVRLGAGAPDEIAKAMRNAYIVPGSDLEGTDKSFG